MKVKTIRVPPELLVKIDELIKLRIYKNRSEFIREAIKKYLESHELSEKKLDSMNVFYRRKSENV